MNSSQRNINILEHIIKYCDQIDEAKVHFGSDFEEFEHNHVYHNAVSMCILQIGELATHLSDDFKNNFDRIPWKSIKYMRNIMAHNYEDMEVEIMWTTMIDDVPTLREYCSEIINNYALANQDVLPGEYDGDEDEDEM